MLFIHKVRSHEKNVLFDLMRDAGLDMVDLEIFYPTFMLAELDDNIVGMGGVEIYGENALLRSLYVKESYKEQLLEDAIIRSLLNLADLRGVKLVYTITQSEKDKEIFSRIGFDPVKAEVLAQACSDSRWAKQQPGQALAIDLKTFFNTPCSGQQK